MCIDFANLPALLCACIWPLTHVEHILQHKLILFIDMHDQVPQGRGQNDSSQANGVDKKPGTW